MVRCKRKRSWKSIVSFLLFQSTKMLNFLYKVPLITRMKTTNGKVGRKYANYEQGL